MEKFDFLHLKKSVGSNLALEDVGNRLARQRLCCPKTQLGFNNIIVC